MDEELERIILRVVGGAEYHKDSDALVIVGCAALNELAEYARKSGCEDSDALSRWQQMFQS
jgi:hypothetical protein